ncbi:MAG: hypothetical protein JSW50_01025 [Candidatus Latescibacterota bacterium]|nr:MAG: hypothetical protein JSW50_01025 [Candidatus Latescibacterota bacterium]
MFRTVLITLVASVIAVGLVPSDSVGQRREKRTGVDFTAYIWPAARSGDVTLQGQTESVDNSIGDMLKFETWAMVFHVEAKKDYWSLILDLNYRQGEEDDLEGNRTETRTWLVEVGGAYWVAYQFEVLGGARFVNLKADITEESATLFSGSESWIDPFVGGRYNLPFARDWKLFVRGDIGGFGIGSKFTWNLVSGVDWRPVNLGFFFGYRVWSVDYESGSGESLFRYKAVRHGPALGLTFFFGER